MWDTLLLLLIIGRSGIFCCKRGGLERTSDAGGGTSGNGNPAYGCIRTTAVEVRGRKKPRGSDPGYGSDVRYGDWIF